MQKKIKPVKEIPIEPVPAEQPTLTQVHKTLTTFMEETRNSLSLLNGDREYDHDFVLKMNQNLVTLEGTVQNLVAEVKRLSATTSQESQKVVNKVGDLQDELAPKPVVTRTVQHFSLKLWWKHLFR